MVDLVNQLLSQRNARWPRRLHASVASLRGRSLADLSSTRTGRFLSGLFFGLVGGLALLTAGALLPRAFGYTPLVVVSGSMEPTLHAGDIAVTRKVAPDEISLGDVVTYRSDSRLITHRIVGLDLTPQGAFYQMQGDANAGRDPQPVSIDQIETKVLYRIPRVGYLVSLVDSSIGILLLIVAPLTMLAMWGRRGKAASSWRNTIAPLAMLAMWGRRGKAASSWRNTIAPLAMLAMWCRGKAASSKRFSLKRRLAWWKRNPDATPEVFEEASAYGARMRAVRTEGDDRQVIHVGARNAKQEYAD